jgi:metal-responsive CopG/Arc/MetJ family transcriptional regulator
MERSMGSVSVTISIPEELIRATDALARERGRSRSSMIAEMLTRQLKAEDSKELALAYQDWADENESLAASARAYAARQLGSMEYDA